MNADKNQEKNFIKEQLENYLQSKGVSIGKPFRCLNPQHEDKKPSMSYDNKRKKAHCFSCGVDYDTFDLIGIDYGLKSSKDIFKKAYELLGNKNMYQNQAKTEQYTQTRKKPKENYTAYFK